MTAEPGESEEASERKLASSGWNSTSSTSSGVLCGVMGYELRAVSGFHECVGQVEERLIVISSLCVRTR